MTDYLILYRHEMSNGPRIIEGKNSWICGLATCISCQEKSSMEESEFRNSCPFQCKASTKNPNEHPLLERSEKTSSEGIHSEENDSEEQSESKYSGEFLNKYSTFTPDYEQIQYCFSALASIYSKNQDKQNINEFSGIRIHRHRYLNSIHSNNRKARYIYNKKKLFYKIIQKSMKDAERRVKVWRNRSDISHSQPSSLFKIHCH